MKLVVGERGIRNAAEFLVTHAADDLVGFRIHEENVEPVDVARERVDEHVAVLKNLRMMHAPRR